LSEFSDDAKAAMQERIPNQVARYEALKALGWNPCYAFKFTPTDQIFVRSGWNLSVVGLPPKIISSLAEFAEVKITVIEAAKDQTDHDKKMLDYWGNLYRSQRVQGLSVTARELLGLVPRVD
jgi:hypothetical protein